MPAFFPSRNVHLRKAVRPAQSACLVGFASEWDDFPATFFLYFGLPSASYRDIWILSGFGPSLSVARTSSLVLWQFKIQISPSARDDLQPSIALGMGSCRPCPCV